MSTDARLPSAQAAIQGTAGFYHNTGRQIVGRIAVAVPVCMGIWQGDRRLNNRKMAPNSGALFLLLHTAKRRVIIFLNN